MNQPDENTEVAQKVEVDIWLNKDGRTILLEQAGVFADDQTLDGLLAKIYAERGRPEIEK